MQVRLDFEYEEVCEAEPRHIISYHHYISYYIILYYQLYHTILCFTIQLFYIILYYNAGAARLRVRGGVRGGPGGLRGGARDRPGRGHWHRPPPRRGNNII